jgi:predicted unusual protein kinase regulating ubiquinone biosynthesis (AarF/ABC1/UbiB family)
MNALMQKVRVLAAFADLSSHSSLTSSAFACGVANIVDRVVSNGFQLKLTSVSAILSEMFSLSREHRVQMDGSYATTAVALAILEGTGKRLNSSIDLFKLAFPLVLEERARRIMHLA